MSNRLPLPGHTIPYRLRLPGPTVVPERVLRAMAQPVEAHRGPAFLDRFRYSLDSLKAIVGRAGSRPFIFASSGVGAMEAGVVNALAPGETALICDNGQWAQVFKRLVEGLGAKAEMVTSPWGQGIDLAAVEARLRRGGVSAVFAVHSESSTGVLADLPALGAIVAPTDALLVVDSVSGAGGAVLDSDGWGIDILVTASQKCLMSPPGLGIASISDKGWVRIQQPDRGPRGYFDFRRFRPQAEAGEPTYTAPVAMVNALHQALTMIDEEGLENAIARHRRLNEALRAGALVLGFTPFHSAPPTPTVVVLNTPAGVNAEALIDHMARTFNTVIAGTYTEALKARMIRIGTMGCCSDGDVLADLGYLARALGALGHKADGEAALAAAQRVLSAP